MTNAAIKRGSVHLCPQCHGRCVVVTDVTPYCTTVDDCPTCEGRGTIKNYDKQSKKS